MALWAQGGLAALGMFGLIFVLVSIVQQIAATRPAATPAQVFTTTANRYPLTVSFSRYPAAAGYALPFAIAPAQPVAGTLTYTVTAVPALEVDATPVNAGLTRDPHVANRVTGAVEITVRGRWTLDITVDGPQGLDYDDLPFTAQAAGGIPSWLAWLIGLVPTAGIALYFVARRRAATAPAAGEPHADAGT